jgi:hypothetical protein
LKTPSPLRALSSPQNLANHPPLVEAKVVNRVFIFSTFSHFLKKSHIQPPTTKNVSRIFSISLLGFVQKVQNRDDDDDDDEFANRQSGE